jgi:serine acetyltransferase
MTDHRSKEFSVIKHRRRIPHQLAAIPLYAASLLLPWYLRRRWLAMWFGYDIHPTSRIGYSLVMPGHLVLAEGARIGHMTVCRQLDLVELGPYATVGQFNWITGAPADDPDLYQHVPHRQAQLIMGPHSALTSRHYADCANSITIGAFSTVAGIRSQFFSHGIDVEQSQQSATPITIGAYVMVGTGSTFLSGASVPDYSVVGAGSIVTRPLTESYYLYAGTPAKPIRKLSPDLKYFRRTRGPVRYDL